jgi:hypothetical protein
MSGRLPASRCVEGIIMRIITCASVIALAALSTPLKSSAQQTTTPANESNTITVRLSNFSFDPDHLRLKTGVPIRLRLVNESGGGHDFSAPTFFAASSFPPGSSAPPNGEVCVGHTRRSKSPWCPGRRGHTASNAPIFFIVSSACTAWSR